MSNTFNTQASQAGKIASTALGLLMPDLVLARTVNRDYENDFGGGVGNVVNVRRPLSLSGNSRAYGATTAITVTSLTEPAVQAVTLDRHIYSAVSLTEEDMNFNLEDFGRQVLLPQTTALGFDIEKAVADEIAATTDTGNVWGSDYIGAFTDARKVLRDMGVPVTGMVAAVGTAVAAALLKTDLLRKNNESGTADALRNATIGRIMGFDIVESNLLPEDEGFFYHRDAFTLAVRAPRVPEGVTFGKSVSGNGFALRYIRDYDPTVLADRSIVSTFIGTQKMGVSKFGQSGVVYPAIKFSPTGA